MEPKTYVTENGVIRRTYFQIFTADPTYVYHVVETAEEFTSTAYDIRQAY